MNSKAGKRPLNLYIYHWQYLTSINKVKQCYELHLLIKNKSFESILIIYYLLVQIKQNCTITLLLTKPILFVFLPRIKQFKVIVDKQIEKIRFYAKYSVLQSNFLK